MRQQDQVKLDKRIEQAGILPYAQMDQPPARLGIRKAFCKNDAGSGNTITCYLGVDKTTENNPPEITVHCEICNGSNLNAAVPRLADGDMLLVVSIGGIWHAVSLFQASEDCST